MTLSEVPLTVFTLTLSQMMTLFLFMLIGFVLHRTGTMQEKGADAISTLLLYLFMPATCFKTFADHCTREVLLTKAPLLIAGFAVLLSCLCIALLLSRLLTKNPLTRPVYTFCLIVSNLGYLGYPLTKAVFGEAMLFDFMVFCMPFNLFIYSFGMFLFVREKKFTLGIFTSPTILAILAGIVCGLGALPLPDPITGLIDTAAAAMAPCAMLVTGLVLAELPLKKTFTDLRAYFITFLRLIGLPLIYILLTLLLPLPKQVSMIACTMLCLPAGLNCVVFARANKGDSDSGAKICFLSNLFGLVTIPLIYALAATLYT